MKNQLLKKYERIKNFKLICAIIVDLAGFTSYFLPLAGDGLDLVWGPISGLFVFLLFPNRKLLALGGALEEMLPLTDFIPTASATWILEYVMDNKKTLSKFVKKEVGEDQMVNEILNSHKINADRK